MKPIWIVDDDESIRWVLEKALARENLATRSFSNAREAMEALKTSTPQVLVSDIRMPGESGLVLLQAVKAQHPGLPVIIITAFSDLDSAVASFQGGAFEYLAKPFDLDKAVELIRRALEESLREASVEMAQTEAPEILGHAPAMQDVFRAIGRLSQSNVTVLITGESGTGKELVARALHKHSPRAAQPFIALNTAAIPKDLLESELFGHERGAFTGAQATRRGRFEQAEGGTLFLDEIGDMPFDLQTRLLRVLSDGHFYRVGGHQPLKANVRVIAATHQNLEQRVRDGLFREDLYHRLNVIRLRLPSLRERREDIPILTRYFLTQSAKQLGAEVKRMSDHAMMFLSSLDLPGNVRQLENLCNWITVMAPGQTVEVKDLPQDLTDGGGFIQAAPGIMAGQVFPSAAARQQPVGGVGGGSGSAGIAGVVGSVGGSSGNGSGVAIPAGRGNVGFSGAFANGTGAAGGADLQANGAAPAETHTASTAGLMSNGHASTALQNGAILAGGATTASAALPEKETWIALLETEAARMLTAGRPEVMDALGRVFESTLIKTALRHTHGRKNDAAVRLGIGRNTITRKIQELGIDGAKED